MQMLLTAHFKYNLNQVCCASSAALPFNKDDFKGILLNGALHHFKVQHYWQQTISEIDRTLKKDGYLFIFDRHDSNLGKRIHKLAMFLRSLMFMWKKDVSTSASDNEPNFSLKDLEYFIDKKGYKVIDIKYTTNVFFFFMLCSCNFIQYTLGYFPSQILRYLLFPIARLTSFFDIPQLCVEQCIVLQKT